jgi:hypothetical protein
MPGIENTSRTSMNYGGLIVLYLVSMLVQVFVSAAAAVIGHGSVGG